MQKIILVRHGETQWSLTGRHTGKTDIPLTETGVKQAEALSSLLQKMSIEKAFVSPLLRAKDTFRLCHLSLPHEVDPDLCEWDYGDYEGLTSKQIHETDPSWSIFTHGALNGESLSDIQKRADRMLAKARDFGKDVALFSSGHILRALAARWLTLPVSFGKHIVLNTASLSILGYERTTPALLLWNQHQGS
jgi:probable phosphoglycerate mutase